METLRGDRADAEALRKALGGPSWDAVIDTSGYMPQVVQRSADALKGRVARYLFVSSISAYSSFDCDGYDEEAPPHDPTDRFTYWPARVAQGGTVLAPGRPERAVQFIDVRDLGGWMIRLLEGNVAGTFNATGPCAPLAMRAVLEACRTVSGSDARFEWIDDARLVETGVAPWRELPLWIPESDSAMRAMMGASIARARDMGLALRPLAETIADTLAWWRMRTADHAWKAGLTRERERALLESARTGSGPSTAPSRRAG